MKRLTYLWLACVLPAASAVSAAPTYHLSTLATFNRANGAYPYAGLIADASGNLYGTTSAGGPNGYGTVFEIANDVNHTLTTLATFKDDDANGESPECGLLADASGNLYGTTTQGGTGGGWGTVFELAAGTYTLTTIATFNRTNGGIPDAGLIADASGNLYGTTRNGGANDAGTVFQLAADTHALSTLATFDGANGALPEAGLIADVDGNLYGTTRSGGANNRGTVFKVAAGTHVLSILATFNGANGNEPEAGLIADADGNLYGTTEFGGANNLGIVFKLAAGTHALTTLATFDGANGSRPQAELIADADGNLYGTTSRGGATNNGTVYKLAAGTHSLTTLATFNGLNGRWPDAGLIADASGNLYGTTLTGGNLMINNGFGGGIVFKLSPVPEPSTFVLVAAGVFGLVGSRRRRATVLCLAA